MKHFALAALYTATLALANPGLADVSAARDAASGEMRKLSFSVEPLPIDAGAFTDFEGAPMTLDQSNGKWRVVNFWATWCPSCRHEMPSLSRLQSELGSEDFEVITIATARSAPQKMKPFFDQIGVENLPLYRDPGSKLSRQLGVLGLPVTLIVDPEGREVARLTGDADWASDEVKAVMRALMEE